jgi:hypothetical protein
MRIFYHRTTTENAALIVRDGFRLDTKFLCRQVDGTMALRPVPGVRQLSGSARLKRRRQSFRSSVCSLSSNQDSPL